VKVAFGPELYGDYVFVKDIDMDFWGENFVYDIVREVLPKEERLFP